MLLAFTKSTISDGEAWPKSHAMVINGSYQKNADFSIFWGSPFHVVSFQKFGKFSVTYSEMCYFDPETKKMSYSYYTSFIFIISKTQ